VRKFLEENKARNLKFPTPFTEDIILSRVHLDRRSQKYVS
jgi:hypothetical protein